MAWTGIMWDKIGWDGNGWNPYKEGYIYEGIDRTFDAIIMEDLSRRASQVPMISELLPCVSLLVVSMQEINVMVLIIYLLGATGYISAVSYVRLTIDCWLLTRKLTPASQHMSSMRWATFSSFCSPNV
eukprot:scaffold343287_cov41-Prasinocladus_malaysianus.AAC.1